MIAFVRVYNTDKEVKIDKKPNCMAHMSGFTVRLSKSTWVFTNETNTLDLLLISTCVSRMRK